MLKNKLTLLLIAAACLFGCSDNSSSAKVDHSTRKFKVSVMASSSEIPRYRRTAEWAMENIKKSQAGLDQSVELQLEFKSQDDADIAKYMERIANDSDYVAVVGPTQSDKAYRMASLLKTTSKPMLSPRASNVEYQRRFADMPNLWNMAENDFLQMETVFSHIQSSLMLSLLVEMVLVAPSDQMSEGLLNSYTDWFGFMAEEYGLTVKGVYLYKNEEELRAIVRELVTEYDMFTTILFDPYNEQMAIALDDELYKRDSVFDWRKQRVYCTSNFVSDSIVKKLHYDFYRGFDLYAIPESGFAQAYLERFDENMIHGEAHFFDALYILAYAAFYSVKAELDLNESVKAIVDGKDGTGGGWMVADMAKNFEAIQDGRLPDLDGVSSSWTFQSKDNSVKGSVYRGWNVANHKYVTNDFTSNDSSKHSVGPQDNWWEPFISEMDTNFFEMGNTNIAYGEVKDRWALLVAGSSGWANYRFQADVFAMYQWLKKLGYDDDHIVLIAEDDLADNKRNLYPGNLHISLDGKNVYSSKAIDYKLSDISTMDLRDILEGKASDELPQVIPAKPTDNIFVFWSGHGMPGALNFGASEISHELLASWIKDVPHRKMMFVAEACYSGGLGKTGEGIPGVVFLTAASPYETSKATERDEEMGVFLSNSFTRGFSELLAENPNATFRETYIELAGKISGSHVQLYNVENYGNIYKERMGEFFVIK